MSQIVQQHVECEKCGSSDAKCVWADGHGYCFSCQHYFPRDKNDVSEGFTYEYLPWRGVTKETFQFYGCKTKIDPSGMPVSLGIPYNNGSHQIRSISSKEFYSTGDIGKAGLFGKERFSAGSSKFVTITEGALDACSLYQAIRSPVVAVQSSSTAVRDCSIDMAWLGSFDKVYLALDNDKPGQDAAKAIAKLFDYNKVYQVKLTKRKDANEYIEHGEEAELKNIWWNSKKYLPDNIISSLSDFNSILNEEDTFGVSYPFPTLTEMTYGIRPGEAVLITALEGVGKTSVMHTIEHHLLKETNDAVGAIYLEEPKKRHLQALAGIELGKPVHLPDCDVSKSEVQSALSSLVGEDDRLHIYSHFGSNDPDALLDTIRFLVAARGCRYILLDHITMAVSGLAGEDERKALDYLSSRLEMMVVELDFALILVSHINDNGETRGSRYIGKICHTRIDLSRDTKGGSLYTNISVSKNRFASKTGPAGKLIFDPNTYLLTEVKDDLLGETENSTSSEDLRETCTS